MIWPFNIYSNRINSLEADLIELQKKVEAHEDIISKIHNSGAFLNSKIILESESISFRNKKSVEDITNILKNSISSLNNNTLELNRNSGEMQYLVEDFDLELKAGLSIEDDGVKFTQLHSSELNPQSVSTLRFKLKPLIKTKISED